MPGPDFYEAMSLVEAVRALAQHHWAIENRHISEYEYELLQEAADVLAEAQRKGVASARR